MVNSTVTDTPGGTGVGSGRSSDERWTAERPGRRTALVGRRRRVPHLVVGLLLVVACAVGVVVLSQQLSQRHPVLVVARPVTAGQVLSAADVSQARVAADAGVAVLGAERLPEVLGRAAAVDLRPGSLLSEQVLGPAAVPDVGEAVVALAVASGRVPPRVQPGASVMVVSVTRPDIPGHAASVAPPPGGGWDAVVLDITSNGEQQPGAMVLTLRLAEPAAREVAALAPDAASVVLTPGGER